MAVLNLLLNATGISKGADVAEDSLQDIQRQAAQTETAVDRMSRGATSSINRMGNAARSVAAGPIRFMGNAFRNARSGISVAKNATQQLGFQIQDFAVQVGAGTSAFTAFAQQGSQLLGVLGPTGAIMGAVLAVAVPLAKVLYDSAGGADAYSDALEALTDRAENALAQLELLKSGFKTREELDAQKQIEALLEKQATIQQSILTMSGHRRRNAQLRVKKIGEEIDALRTQMGILQDAREETARIKRTNEQIKDIMDAMNLSKVFTDAVPAADVILAKVQSIASGIGGALQSAAARIEHEQAVGRGRGLVAGPSAAEIQRNVPSAQLAYSAPASFAASSGGGGGGGASQINNARSAFDSLLSSLDPLVAAQQDFAEAQEVINAALDAGEISATEAARAYKLASDEFAEASAQANESKGIWHELSEVGGSAIDRLIDGTATLKDGLKDVIKEMVLLIAKKRLLGSIEGGSKSDSVGGLIFKGLFGGFFDKGGTLGLGQTGIVGENGPEPVKATSRGAVITGRQKFAQQSSQQASAARVEVVGGNLTLSDDGKIMAQVQVQSAQARQGAVSDVRRSFGSMQQSQGTFGAMVG